MARTVFTTEDGRNFGNDKAAAQRHANFLVYFDEGNRLSAQGNYDAAINAFNTALSIEKNYDAMHNISNVYIKKGDYDTAEKYVEGIDRLPHLVNHGRIHLKRNNLDKAIELFDKVIENESWARGQDGQQVALAFLYRGIIYSKQGNDKEAIRYFKNAYNRGREWEARNISEEAYKLLAEKGIQYDENYRKKEQEESSRKYFAEQAKQKNTKNTDSTSTFSTSKPITGKGILVGLVLGAICGLISTIAIGGIVDYFTGANIVKAHPFIWITVIAVIFLYVWLKRKWLWITILALPSLVGFYIMCFGVPSFLQKNEPKTEIAAPAKTATITAKSLNLRAEPRSNGTVVKSLKKNDIVTVISDNGDDWILVEYEGVQGYVSSQYITLKK